METLRQGRYIHNAQKVGNGSGGQEGTNIKFLPNVHLAMFQKKIMSE